MIDALAVLLVMLIGLYLIIRFYNPHD